MTVLADLIGEGRPATNHRPWPRAAVETATWNRAIDELATGRLSLVALWGAREAVHMALLDAPAAELGVVTLASTDGGFPSVGARHAAAIRPERAIRDLFGLRPLGAPDTRAWLDHGRWGLRAPLAAIPGPAAPGDGDGTSYRFLAVEGESLHQIPVGPVHAGVIEPGHFRFTASGETVVRLEERLGYTHKGIEGLMAGAELERGARLAGRTSGDSTVAYACAFARAVEAATGSRVPARAQWLRALMAELERLANHFGDIGAVCNDAAFALMHAHCGILRERTLRAADACFGHRFMRDKVVPGGVDADLDAAGRAALAELLDVIAGRFPALVELYDNTASLKERTFGTGYLAPELARDFGAGGFVGRASGRDFDARRLPGQAPYDELDFDVPVVQAGDVNARVWIRIEEVHQSLALVGQILDRLPEGDLRAEVPAVAGEGMALVEGFRGDVFAWVRLAANGTIERCHLRDPSWFQWPLLEVAIKDNIVADFPLCNKSFNCSYSGHDL